MTAIKPSVSWWRPSSSRKTDHNNIKDYWSPECGRSRLQTDGFQIAAPGWSLLSSNLSRQSCNAEFALTHLTENQQILHRHLMIAGLKIRKLESRVASQKISQWDIVAFIGSRWWGSLDQSRAFNTDDILPENQWQGELISTLQNTLQMRERTITGLQMVLDETCRGDSSGCCSACDISGHQSNAVPDSPCQGILIGDEETLCEINTESRSSVGSPWNQV